jgi:hypothetical protein
MQRTVVYTFTVSARFFMVVPWYRKVLEVVFFSVFGLVICSGWFFGFIFILKLVSITLFPVLTTDVVSDIVSNPVTSETIRRVVASEREVVAPQSHEVKHSTLYVSVSIIKSYGIKFYFVVDTHNAFTWGVYPTLDPSGSAKIRIEVEYNW